MPSSVRLYDAPVGHTVTHGASEQCRHDLGKYTVLVGGRQLGDRLNFIYKDTVPEKEVVDTLVPLLMYFKQDREDEETFGDFCHRKGLEDLTAWSDRYTAQAAS